MLKILFFADSHLGFDFPIHPRINRRRRGLDFFNNYQKILDTAVEERVDAIVHGGDVFFRSKIPPLIIQKAYEPLLPLLESGIRMFFVPGNHERSRLPLSPLFHHHHFHLFDRPRCFSMEVKGVKVEFGGFPNIRRSVQEAFPVHLNQIGFSESTDHVRVLCMHQSIEGARVGVQNYTFRKGSDVINQNQFSAFLDLVLSGHIHRHQVLNSTEGIPLLYPGSIERTSFAERLEAKGFLMIQLSQSEINWEFRALPTRPMHEWTLPVNLVDGAKLIDAIQEQASKIPDDAILRIRAGVPDQLSSLKISELRHELPDTMNVDLLPISDRAHSTWLS